MTERIVQIYKANGPYGLCFKVYCIDAITGHVRFTDQYYDRWSAEQRAKNLVNFYSLESFDDFTGFISAV